MQYADKYKPTVHAVGDLTKSSKVSGFAKLSDVAINSIPADEYGYFYFKLVQAGDTQQPFMLARTKYAYNDTARGFGWLGEYDLCNTPDVTKCDWKTAHNGISDWRGIHFDTLEPFPFADDCTRWFTDHHYSGYEKDACYEFNQGAPRCFAKGHPCVGEIRDHVTMYKLFAPQNSCKGISTDKRMYFCV